MNSLIEVFQLLFYEKSSRGSFDMRWDSDDRGMGSVACAKGIIDEIVYVFGELDCEFRIVLLFLWIKTEN